MSKREAVEDSGVETARLPGATVGNAEDQHDMRRMGRKQELRREFRFFSIWGYAVILGASWEFAYINGVLSFPNGGTAGTIWVFLITCIGMFFVTLYGADDDKQWQKWVPSPLRQVASITGAVNVGRLHMVNDSPFADKTVAPPRYQKLLSYCVGFLCVLGWQVSLSGACFVSALQIEAIISLALAEYVSKGWHTTFLAWGALCVGIFSNTIIVRKLPIIEGIFMVLHVFGFFIFLVVLWVMAPRGDVSVFTTFENNGWSSNGLASLVGISAALGDVINSDSAVHLCEELHNASWILPRAMVGTAVMNYVLGFIAIVTLVFCVGNLEEVLQTKTGQPYVQVILNATESRAATIIMTALIVVLLIASVINVLSTSSRQLWSFARDGAVPFSRWLSKVKPGWDIPVNALCVSMAITVILSTVLTGSTAAYGIIVTLGTSGLSSSYIICIACIFWRRCYGQPLPKSRFNLGWVGNVINTIALTFLLVAWVFQFFPAAPNPDPTDMNWSILIYAVVITFFLIYYFFRARHRYTGPVVLVRRDS